MTLLKTVLASVVLISSLTAHAGWGDRGRDRRGPPRGDFGRGGGDFGRGGFGSSACQDALANLQYTQSELAKYTALIQQSDQICGANPFCRQTQVQAWQYAATQVQNAEQRRQQACN